MAVVWAKSNGNWATASIWAFWNETTQQIEDYGQIPQSDDIVYCNGYIINVGSDNITVNTLSNDVNPYTLNDGGYITISSGSLRNINANLICGGYNLIRVSFSTGGLVNINGSITAATFSNEYVVKRSNTGNNRSNLHIQGNVNISGLGGLYDATGSNNSDLGLIINGNVILNNNVILLNGYSISPFGNVIINGDLKVAANVTIPLINSFTINGNYQTETQLNCNSFLIGGRIQYKSTNGNVGICFKTMSVINPNTFTWEDITGPRVNPYIIVTDYQLNNIYNYPTEDEVKEGTEYAWGEKVGTYQAPPESVVLKDYEYDTITAEENDIATYNLTRYIYADYGTLHWFELKTTTTDIVTDPTSQSIDIDGDTVVADTDYVVEYNDVCYQWSGSAWGSITTKNIGTVKTDIVTNPTEATLCAKKGSLETTNISQQLISRLENCATIETVQQLLVAHLDN